MTKDTGATTVPAIAHSTLPKPTACRTCGEPIYLLKHQRTGKLAPIEAKTDPGGNILVQLTYDTYCIANAAERVCYPQFLHFNHFARCPQSKFWKREARQ